VLPAVVVAARGRNERAEEDHDGEEQDSTTGHTGKFRQAVGQPCG
jgi:hypothetical protein